MLQFSSICNDSYEYQCFFTGSGKIVFAIFTLIHVITLLPLCTYILYLCFQELQRRTSTSSAAIIRHCDIFTYHMVVMELIGVLGCIMEFSGNYMTRWRVFLTGFIIFTFTGYGQLFFHILTCMERYMAVVHPIMYLSIRNERGTRIRNVTIGFVWLLSYALMMYATSAQYIYIDTSLNVLSTAVISFCSCSVLIVLIRPGPGQEGRGRADKSKKRAFLTIIIILGVLMFRLCYCLVWAGLDLSGHSARCITMILSLGINLPSSLVLPLLFLQRAGKLMCCKN